MKHIIHSLAFALTIIPVLTHAVSPFIQPRSQSEDSARELVGWTRYINKYDQEQVYGSWAFTLEYSKTMRPDDIAETLFGPFLLNDKQSTFIVSGSQSGDRNATDLLADYFGLPTDYKSNVSFSPRVDNVILDIDFYLGLDQWLDGMYFRIHAPVVYTRWDLNMHEKVIDAGVNPYPAGYFGPTAVPRSQLVPTFIDFAMNGATPVLGDSIFFNSLEFAKMTQRRLSKTRLSDVQFALGWNFLQGDDHHFGLNIRGAAPTGNRPKGEYLFEPLVGNGHHWELGLGLTSHYVLFFDECTDRSVGLYFDANITHLFAARQTRTFDLVGKPLSRYMLIERLGKPVTNLYLNAAQGTANGSVAPTNQFQNLYTSYANVSTFDVNVRIAAQVDATAMLNMRWNHWDLDLGYNFWARTCEKIKPTCQCSILFDSAVNFGLKGDAYTYGFVAHNAVGLPAGINPGDPIPLSATESKATISTGTNNGQPQNAGIDLSMQQWAMVDTTNDTDQIVVAPGDDGGANTQQRSSLNPVLIQSADIDFEGAETKGLSNRLFAHLSYNWDERECAWTPFLGFGGSIELAHHGSENCSDAADDGSCEDCAFSQWGVWVKGGVSF